MAYNFLSNKSLRNWHRDIGYFFVGLIIAFAVSGIAQNHRKLWKPDKYLYEYKKLPSAFSGAANSVQKLQLQAFGETQQLGKLLRSDSRNDSTVVAVFANADITIHLENGMVEMNLWKPKPVLAQMAFLHKFTGNWWIWYSDIFALGLIFITVSGMFLMRGKYSFKKRGWWLALMGIIFPIAILVLFYQ